MKNAVRSEADFGWSGGIARIVIPELAKRELAGFARIRRAPRSRLADNFFLFFFFVGDEGIVARSALELRKKDSAEYQKRSLAAMAEQRRECWRCKKLGAMTFDYGNIFER